MPVRRGVPVVVLLLVCAIGAVCPAAATAQVIGTFTWQTQPYCNVVTVQVIQQGPLYQLIGTDSLCGAGTAPVTGTAVPAGGNVVFGMTAALPTGRAAHLSATIALANLSGTWSDADGNSGVFAFGAAAAGAARPAPASVSAITVNQFAPTVYAGSGSATTVARSDHAHDDRYYTRTESDARQVEVAFSPFFNSPTIDFSSNSRTVTTTRAGRIHLQQVFSFNNITCTSGTPTFYLQLDGVTLPGSGLSSGTSTFAGYLIGTTEQVVPAGVHNVGYGIDCPTGPLTGGSIGFPATPRVTAIVLP